MRIGFDGSCLSNRRGFGRFSRLLLECAGSRPGKHQLVVIIDRPSDPAVTVPEGCERIVVDVGEAPSAAASAQGRRRFGDMLAMGRAVARRRLGPHVLPRDLHLLPGLERAPPGRDHARHPGAGPSGARLPHPPGPPGLAAQGARRRADGRPHRDRLRDVPARPSGLVSPARRTDSGSSPRGRPDLPAGGRDVLRRDRVAETRDSSRSQVPALRRRPEPAQEPASADRGVFPDRRATTCYWSWSAT